MELGGKLIADREKIRCPAHIFSFDRRCPYSDIK
jgi:hypothetical protein